MAANFPCVVSRCLHCTVTKQSDKTHIVGSTKALLCHQSKRSQSTGQRPQSSNLFIRYLRSLKWVPIPVGVGVAYLCYQQYGHSVKREKRKIQNATDPSELLARPWQVTLYRKMPLKTLSRFWGRFNQLELPRWLRKPALGLYIWMFNCDLQEAAIEDLTYYQNLGEFFRRKLKPNVRSVDPTHCLTSPSDGKVLHFGKVEDGVLEQVKGVNYSLSTFIGSNTWNKEAIDSHIPTSTSSTLVHTEDAYLTNPGNDLYHCVIYLAPGDYHRFHSPTDWSVFYRRHFPGELLSVNPGIARWIQGLFNYNERVVYCGKWKHGFFSMAAVGATSVGSIKVYFDKYLKTNCDCKWPEYTHFDHSFCEPSSRPSGIPVNKGEIFGEFNLGSTIILIFEAPRDFNFKIQEGQTIKYGEPIG